MLVEFTVDGEGRVHEAQVIRSVHPSLDSAALRAVRRTTFDPGRHEGENVAVRMHLPVNFQLVGQE